MVKQHNQLMSFCLGVCDLAVIAAAWLLAYKLRFDWFPAQSIPPLRPVLQVLGLILLVSGLVLVGSGLYRPRRDKSFLLELGAILKATFVIWCLLTVVLYNVLNNPFSRGMLALFLPLMTAGLIVERGAFRVALRTLRQRGWNQRYALIVGTGRLAQNTLLKLQHNSWTGIRVVGFLDPHDTTHRTTVRGVPVLGARGDLLAVIAQRQIDSVFVALPAERGALVRGITRDLEQTAADVRVVPDLFVSRFAINLRVHDFDGLPIISLRENPLAGWSAVYKRMFDVFGALVGLLVAAGPMLLIAAAIKLTSPGPVLYRQRRVSYGGKPFAMLKFRSMRTDSETAGPQFAAPNDDRCTPLGRWLRSSSLDELPQLWNVLVGDMSLVGPRPERPEMLEKIRHEIPGFPLRLKVRAGLTGWAQVNGFRGRTSFRKRLQYDLYYLNHWSPLLDLRIVLATLVRGFRHPNAY